MNTTYTIGSRDRLYVHSVVNIMLHPDTFLFISYYSFMCSPRIMDGDVGVPKRNFDVDTSDVVTNGCNKRRHPSNSSSFLITLDRLVKVLPEATKDGEP